jgi:hypothetical protein
MTEVQMAKKHMKWCLTSLAIKEMKTKTTLRFYLTPFMAFINTTTNVGKSVREKKHSYNVGWNVN